MPVNEIQSTLLNAVTVTGPSTWVDLTLQPCQWLVLTVTAENAQVQLEYSNNQVEGSQLPIPPVQGQSNPVNISAMSTVSIMCSGAYRYVRANVLQLQRGSVTAVLQGYPWDFPAPAAPVLFQVGATGAFTPNPLQPGAQGGYLPLPAGSTTLGRTDSYGALYTAQLAGRYEAMVRSRQVFCSALQGTQALSTNSTTATGIILTNPIDSPVNLVVLEIQVDLASLPAGQSTIILTGQPISKAGSTPVAHTTQLPVWNALLGCGGVGYGKCDSAATIPDNKIIRVLGTGTAATVAGSTSFPPFINDETEGIITLGPNTCISVQALTTAITIVGSIIWREVPINAS